MSQHQRPQDPITPPSLPLPIYRLSASRKNKYFLYDIDTVTWLRANHHILGVQIGGLPQFSQQNVFFGLPLELMPEEARLLVEKGIAFVIDDLEAHKNLVTCVRQGRPDALAAVDSQKAQMGEFIKQAKEAALVAKLANAEKGREMRAKQASSGRGQKEKTPKWNAAQLPIFDHMEAEPPLAGASLFDPDVTASTETKRSKQREATWAVTPTTSGSLMPSASLSESQIQVETVESHYSVFKRLHDQGYYMTPGLRFGCHFTAYPGDPLRYHSHFLANGVDWDEELDLLDIVGGGRLGTGVKKGFLIGGTQADGDRKGETRTFCIEWGGM